MALCYKDRTFCLSDCVNTTCFHHFGEEERKGARLWWSHDPDHVPVAMSDFSKNCKDYKMTDTAVSLNNWSL